MTKRTTGRRAARRGLAPRVEAMESRQLLATVTGSLSRADAALTSPLPGRSAYVDLDADGRLDPTDPSAITAADGSFAIAGVPVGSYVVRVAPGPGESATTAAITVASDQDATAAPLALASGSPALPLTYATSRFGASVTNAVRAEVDALYGAILGRTPDAPGAAAAGVYLRTGGTTGGLATSLLESTERLNGTVTSYYVGLLGRVPSAGEVRYWVGRQEGGWSEVQVVGAFLASPEFDRLHADDPDFIRAVYVDILGRPAGESEVAAVTQVMADGLSRAGVIRSLLGSAEAATRAATGLYTTTLGRRPDAVGGFNAASALRSGSTTPVRLAASLFGSAEFAAGARSLIPKTARATLAIAGRTDFVFDDDGILYVTDGGSIDRYDTRAGIRLSSWELGGDLLGIDLSPDGKTLAVADREGHGIDLVDTTTGIMTRVDYELDLNGTTGSHGVAWGADGAVVFSSPNGGAPLRRYDPASGETTIVARNFLEGTTLSASADRRTIGVVEASGSGALRLYSVADRAIIATAQTGLGSFAIAINADGTQVTAPNLSGAFVFDRVGDKLVQNTILRSDLAVFGVYYGQMGAVYSPTSHYLFTAEPEPAPIPGVAVIDTSDLSRVATIEPTRFLWDNANPFYPGWMRVSPDGRTLAVSTAAGLKVFDVSAYS